VKNCFFKFNLYRYAVWRGDGTLTPIKKIVLAAGCGLSTVGMIVGAYAMW
jgi:hypothetical protein